MEKVIIMLGYHTDNHYIRILDTFVYIVKPILVDSCLIDDSLTNSLLNHSTSTPCNVSSCPQWTSTNFRVIDSLKNPILNYFGSWASIQIF